MKNGNRTRREKVNGSTKEGRKRVEELREDGSTVKRKKDRGRKRIQKRHERRMNDELS